MWFLFAVLTTLIWGFAELYYKKGAVPDEKYSHLKICIFVGLVMGIHGIVTLLTGDVGYNAVNIIKYLPVSLFYIFSMAFSFFGMRYIMESISDPIENTSGAICSLLCVMLLGEGIGIPSVIAIIIMVIGILGIGFLEKDSEARKSNGRLAAVAFVMPFLYAILDAVGSFLDITYLDLESTRLVDVGADNIEMVANISYEFTFAIVGIILYIFVRLKGEKINISTQGDKILAAVFETGGQLTYVYAMSGNGAIAAPIISSVCVVSLLLSRIILKEKLSIKQYFFIGLVILSIIMLAVIEGE